MEIFRVSQITDEIVSAFDRLIPQLTRRQPPTAEELVLLISSPSILIIARHPDQTGPIVGAGTLGVFCTPTGLHAHIEDVVVDNDFRRQGIGDALVTELLKIARGIGVDGVSLTCNPSRFAANSLYEKMGFVKWETNVYWYDLTDNGP
jgi:ribosomal protein S18 acetylase RimI-like enzyme